MLVLLTLKVYNKSAALRDKVLSNQMVVVLVRLVPTSNKSKRLAYALLSVGLVVGAVWRWWCLRRRLLSPGDGPLEAARESASKAALALDASSQQVAEMLELMSSVQHELAACRLAITEVQQAVRREENEQQLKRAHPQQSDKLLLAN